MCRKPPVRQRAKRMTWLRRWINVLKTRLDFGFSEAWCGKRHWTVETQVNACKAKLSAAEKELADLCAPVAVVSTANETLDWEGA